MALDEITERVVIGLLGRYEFDAIPWRVPFEAEAIEGLSISGFFKKNYKGIITDKQVEVLKKMGPVDIIGIKNNKIYFFLVKKPENSSVKFSSEDEKKNFLNAKKKNVNVYIIENPYPEHMFKVYDAPKEAIVSLKIKLNKCKLVNLEKI